VVPLSNTIARVPYFRCHPRRRLPSRFPRYAHPSSHAESPVKSYYFVAIYNLGSIAFTHHFLSTPHVLRAATFPNTPWTSRKKTSTALVTATALTLRWIAMMISRVCDVCETMCRGDYGQSLSSVSGSELRSGGSLHHGVSKLQNTKCMR
jgi:hypothetical protein